MKHRATMVFGVILAVALSPRAIAGANPCESIKSLTLARAMITATEIVSAGDFAAPASPTGPANPTFRGLPEFCRASVTLQPSSDSDIKVEVWLPVSGWNGKFQAVGNGAWSGAIGYAAMSEALRRGYATASTDTGHVGGSASFALGHPEKLIDFAYRSEHEMTVQGKAIVTAFYGRAPAYSYWNGCSAGGRQALKEAQMFPGDFDGIIAGAPGLDWSGRSAQAVRIAQAIAKTNSPLGREQIERLHGAVVAACDGDDGLKDGLIGNPVVCTFDPKVLQCAGTPDSKCLTSAQVETVRLIYSPIANRKTNRQIPGLAHGSELGWTEHGWTGSARATGLDHFRYVIFKDPQWTLMQFEPATDIPRLEENESAALDARDPNLKAFFDRGGKLLYYHGWADPQISPLASTTYYESVLAALGGESQVSASYRLFMAPGMGHCGGGDGPNDFDKVAALEQWVEHGRPPDWILATHSDQGKIDRSRPLCPFPQLARHKRNGSIDDAANFTCVKP